MNRNRGAWIVAGALVLCASAPAALGTVKNLKSFEIKNNTGSDATTYNLILKGLTPADIDKDNVSGTLPLIEVSAVQGGVLLRFRDTANPVKDGDPGKFKIPMKALPDNKKLQILTSSWSTGGPLGPARVPGFGVMGDPIYTISNDLEAPDDVPLEVRDLQFMVNVPEIPLSSLEYDLVPSGWDPPVQSSLDLDPTDSFAYDVGQVDTFNWFYARGQIFDPVTGEELGWFIDGSQQVPTGPTLGVLVSVAAWQVRRRRPVRLG